MDTTHTDRLTDLLVQYRQLTGDLAAALRATRGFYPQDPAGAAAQALKDDAPAPPQAHFANLLDRAARLTKESLTP